MIRRIEIDFPCSVDVPDGFYQALDSLVNMVCKKYERENTGRVMWPGACGSKLLSNPHMVGDDEPLDFDDSVYSIVVSEREDYHNKNKNKDNNPL